MCAADWYTQVLGKQVLVIVDVINIVYFAHLERCIDKSSSWTITIFYVI